MALTIKWSKKAKTNYDAVLAYLYAKWFGKEVEKFINKTNSILTIISHQPYIFKASGHKRIRKAVIGKQNSMFYLVHESEVYYCHFG